MATERDDSAQKLRDACGRGDLEAARALLAAGASVEARDEKGKTALYFAAKGGDVRVMELLLDHGADLRAVTEKRKSILYAAAFRGGVDAVRFVLARGHPVDVVDEDERTALFGAAQNNDVESMRVLVDHGVDVHAEADNERTAFHDAARCGSIDALAFLLEQGLAVDAVNEDGETALHYAAGEGYTDTVAFLLEHGASVDAVDEDEKMALHYAADNGHTELVRFLLEQGVAVDEGDEDGTAAIHFAAAGGHTDTVAFLLEHGASVDAVDEEEKMALHYAADNGHTEVVRFLLEQGVAVDEMDEDGTTALHYAAGDGYTDTVAFLLEQGASVHAGSKDCFSAFLSSAKDAHLDCMRLLVEHGADAHALMEDGLTALHCAAEKGNPEAVAFLLEQGLSVHTITENGASVLNYAATGGDVGIVTLLLDRGADVHSIEHDGRTVLHSAARAGSVDVVRLLLDRGLAVNAVDKNGSSVVEYAAMGGNVSTMRVLFEHGADVHMRSKTGSTALHAAVNMKNVDAVKYLLDQGLSVDPLNNDGFSPLHCAAQQGDVSIMRLLVGRGADVQRITKKGDSALHHAARKGHTEAVSFLLECGSSIEVVNKAGESVLRSAAISDNFDVMQVLISHGVDTHTTLKDGRSALHYAAEFGDAETVSSVLAQGHAVNSPDRYGNTAFDLAVERGDVGIMRILLDHGADALAKTKEHRTALHRAAYYGKVDALQLLLELGLPIEATEEDGSTPFHEAATEGDTSALRFLVDHDADVSARLKDGRSALHVSAKYGTVEAAKFLIKLGLAIDEPDKDGNTPLHIATEEGQLKMMKFLIDEGADAHAQTKSHENIVHVAAGAAEVGALKYALELGVDANAQAEVEGDWKSPFAIAFDADDCDDASQMVFALCSAGARLDEEDRQTILALSESTNGSMSEVSAEKTPSESALWRSGLCVCVGHWTKEHESSASKCTKVPVEVIRRGAASVRTYLKDVAQSTNEDSLHRCKICVVGPSEWGKTSLVQSLKTDNTFLTQLKDRTIGIDLTTCELTGVVDNSPVRVEITFWDFAGQDVYHAAHTLFFSQRTLFVLVVNLEAYWKELKDAESKPDQVCEAQMNRFVAAKIFRWVRSIFAHRPDAQFVVVGSKMDRLDDVHVVAEIWDDLRDRVDRWKTAFAKGFDTDLLPARATGKDVKELQAKLSQLGSSEWLVANIMEVESIRAFRSTVQSTITSSELGFPMWKTYRNVLVSVVKRREEAQRAVSARERIEKSIIRFTNLRRQLLREIDGLERDACEQILRTLNDLGDVLWYEHDEAGVFKDCIILDPMLVIEVVREVIRHDFSSDVDGKPPTDGRITHSLLSTFPLWKDMDVELMHAFKALLQHFQLAYPADADMMLPESDIIVPAYWNADQPSIGGSKAKPKFTAPQKSVCDTFAVHRWCWEYEIPSELSETIFVQFAVQSHSSYLTRTIRGFCVEAACAEFATSISLVQSDSPRDVLRIEVSGVSAELSWHNMRFYLMKMEKVLEGYPGDVVWRSIVYRPDGSSSESRHPVGPLVKAIEDAIAMGRGTDAAREKMAWMPPDMDWFMHKSWNDIASFQQLRMDQLVHEKLEVLQKLAIVGDAPRQFPALWSLEYFPEEQKALLRMSSDLTGRCYHVPLEITTGSSLLARHGSVLKAGVSLFATVVGNAVSLPIVQNVLDFATSTFDNNVDHAERVHNLIDKLDMNSERFDTRTTGKLSPGASMVLLRDLLKAYDDSLDALEISEISNLECAVTSDGEYVWAHESEVMAMKGKLTRCSTPPSAWKELELPETKSTSVISTSPTSTSTIEAFSPSSKSSTKTDFKFSVCVDSVVGLSDWDWHKTYCKWQLYFGRKSLTPLAVDVTPTNGDSSCAPSWSTMRKTIESVASVDMLRECRLAVQVKRRSRIGWTKLIGEGEVWLRDFVNEEASQNFSCEPVRVPLGTATDRAVIIQLALAR